MFKLKTSIFFFSLLFVVGFGFESEFAVCILACELLYQHKKTAKTLYIPKTKHKDDNIEDLKTDECS